MALAIRDIYTAKAVALNQTEVASNRIPYLGEGFFPPKKKMGLDLKWIKTSKGLPVSLMPSAFDTVSTIRSREGFTIDETEMAYFKESFLVKEREEQDIMRVQESADPYAQDILNRIYDDANNLIEGARVVPERMIWQLLAATDGSPKISLAGDGATYEYNYDPQGTYKTNNFVSLSGTSKWDDTANSDPISDVMNAQDAVEALTGSRPAIMVISKKTMNLIKQNAKVRSYILAQNATATVIITDARVKEIFQNELGINVIVYSKQFKDETGTAKKFYPDGMATLLPQGELGNTWRGVTPSERTLLSKPEVADVAIIDEGIAVEVTTTTDPVHTKTTVSEIVLPSFERMDETYQIKCY